MTSTSCDEKLHAERKPTVPLGFYGSSTFVLSLPGALQAFRLFLRSEFSEENLEFWLACETYRLSGPAVQRTKASSIYSQFINPDAPQEVGGDKRRLLTAKGRDRHLLYSSQVNLDAETREALLSESDSPGSDTFIEAQQRIFSLMAKDSFPRFLRSHC